MLAAQPQLRIHTRWMIRMDFPSVLEIEAASFDFAWTEDDFLRCLRQRNAIGMVAEHDDRVVGHMVYELRKTSLKILNFAVHPDCRRRGVGRQMAEKLVGKLSSHHRTRLFLYTRESNLGSHLFWRAVGLRAVNVVPDYYQDSGEAAYRFSCRVPVETNPLE